LPILDSIQQALKPHRLKRLLLVSTLLCLWLIHQFLPSFHQANQCYYLIPKKRMPHFVRPFQHYQPPFSPILIASQDAYNML
jgi:hypothetical protein